MISEDIQKLSVDALLSLYQLDTTPVLGDDGGLLHFCNETIDEGGVIWRGQLFSKIAIEVEGFEARSNGTLPQPTVSINNILGTLSARNSGLNDLLGMKFTRWRVFAKNLDSGSDANEDVFVGPDVFFVERKTSQNKIFVTWQLKSALDLEGINYPLKVVTKDIFPGAAKIRR